MSARGEWHLEILWVKQQDCLWLSHKITLASPSLFCDLIKQPTYKLNTTSLTIFLHMKYRIIEEQTKKTQKQWKYAIHIQNLLSRILGIQQTHFFFLQINYNWKKMKKMGLWYPPPKSFQNDRFHFKISYINMKAGVKVNKTNYVIEDAYFLPLTSMHNLTCLEISSWLVEWLTLIPCLKCSVGATVSNDDLQEHCRMRLEQIDECTKKYPP